jgi:nitroreductase
MNPLDPVLESILDLARWAPSGDNTQPWRFEIVDARHLVIHGFDTRSHVVYDLDGHPSQMSLGALLETMAIAASTHGLALHATRRHNVPEDRPTLDVALEADAAITPDPLADSIRVRCVQRRPLSTRPLSATEKTVLAAALPAGYQLLWLEGRQRRWDMARLLFRNAHLRLTMPEAHQVHRDVIEWNARYSNTAIPDQALGVDAVTAKVMRWVMHSWGRVEFFNTWLGGTLAPRLQMDLLPAMACAAHLVLLAERPPAGTDDYLAAGRAIQRLWLTATRLGLQMQPEMTPLIFSRYVRERRSFSRAPGMQQQAEALAAQAGALIGAAAFEHAVFLGRIGAGPPATARSLRRPLAQLILPSTKA